MNKLGLIIKREYMSIVGKKSFLVMTFLIPIIIVLCIQFMLICQRIMMV